MPVRCYEYISTWINYYFVIIINIIIILLFDSRQIDSPFDPDEDAQLINLRKYEMEKLKYYYAVVTCDSAETADAIYKACDGMEFLKSGVVIDLRLVSLFCFFEFKQL